MKHVTFLTQFTKHLIVLTDLATFIMAINWKGDTSYKAKTRTVSQDSSWKKKTKQTCTFKHLNMCTFVPVAYIHMWTKLYSYTFSVFYMKDTWKNLVSWSLKQNKNMFLFQSKNLLKEFNFGSIFIKIVLHAFHRQSESWNKCFYF